MSSAGHEWTKHEREGWSVCSRCGMVRNYDREQTTCSGALPKIRQRSEIEDCAAMDALEQLRHAGEDQETNAASVMEDALNYLWSKLYDGTTDWEYPGQVANHALEAIREQTERADAAEAKAKALGEALREAQWAIRTLRDASQPGSSPLSAAETARIHTALREAGMEEAPEPAMHYDSSGRPMHPVSECRPGVCWTDEAHIAAPPLRPGRDGDGASNPSPMHVSLTERALRLAVANGHPFCAHCVRQLHRLRARLRRPRDGCCVSTMSGGPCVCPTATEQEEG